MDNTWDTIVVGAGLGGLTSAARLVKTGKRVLVLEKNPHIGGTAYVYRRNGFTFPMGPLGFSNPQKVEGLLHNLDQDIGFTYARVHYCLRAFDLTLRISRPFPEMVEELARHFPAESQSIRHFFLDVDEFISSPQFLDTTADSKPVNEKYQISMSDYLRNITKDWRLQCILGSLGTRKPYTSFPLQAAMWNIMSKEGIWYPGGGFESFCNRLAQAVTGNYKNYPTDMRKEKDTPKLSGVIRLGTAVEKIWVEHGRVAGVILADGTSIPASSVISNADYKSTFLTLLGPSISPEWYSAISQAKQAGSIFQVCLGIDMDRVDLSAFREASRLIYRRDNMPLQSKIDWHRAEVDLDAIAGQEIEVSCWNQDDRTLAPQGSAVIVIRTEALYEHFSQFHLGWRLRSPNYHNYKMRVAHALINEVEKIVPGLNKAISVMDVATPITFADQGARSQGAVAGWSWKYEDIGNSGFKELVLTPIRGLYMAGYQAFSALFMGGVPTAIESGCRAAEAVLQNTDPVNSLRIPGVQ